MAGMIYADKTMDELRAYADRKCANGHMDTANGILSAVNYIRNNVTRVDAEEVVRCWDCEIHGHCITEDMFTVANISDPFCCAGKRKDGVE